jgi:hypothetical protein
MPKKLPHDKKLDMSKRFPKTVKSGHSHPAVAPRPRAIGELLARAGAGRVTREVTRQQSWTDWLRAAVPAALAPHIVQVVAREHELIVYADTSAWGVRLRYALAELTEAVRQHDPNILSTRLRVQPPI